MGFQEVVKELFDFLIGYQYKNDKYSSDYKKVINKKKEEEIIKKLLIKTAKINVCIRSINLLYLLECYRKILLNILNDTCVVLFNQKIENRVMLADIFASYIEKLEKMVC